MKKIKNVIVYIRVGTDEQKDRGYSLPAQLEKIEKYCHNKDWNIIERFQEDYTAWKGFDRPTYNQLKVFVKENKGNIDYLLFTQWSRFSRDSAEAHLEIKNLKALGIEANAVEQWIDYRIPENLYMLSFFLAAPQVENDRLSLRVKDAVRKALKLGKWMGRAPYGYLNDKNSKLVLPDPNTSDMVKFAFETFATGAYTITEVRKMAQQRGLAVQKQQFINLLKNPFYAGKIRVKAMQDEPESFVNGIHEPLVNNETFMAVQRILLNRSKPYQGHTKREELPLMGFIYCPKCGKAMTGSASRGNGGYYHYYHCQRKYGCHNSFSASTANQQFEKYLAVLRPNKEVLDLFHVILEDVFKTDDVKRFSEQWKVEDELRGVDSALQSLDAKMLNGDLPTERYNRLAEKIEQRKAELFLQKITLSQTNGKMKEYLDFCFTLLADLPNYYFKASATTKRKIVGSIFPEKLFFDGKGYRTTKMNEVFELICRPVAGSQKKQLIKNDKLSSSAPAAGLEPATL